MGARVMLMAGGTGGHVYPALAVAEELQARGLEILWLGSSGSFEARVVPEHGIRLERISIRGVRGSGIGRRLAAPFRLLLAMLQSFGILRRNKPGLVLGMGGFVAGPGGVVARLLGIPLVIHEQNAIPGLTNQWLSRFATRVLEAFPGSFDPARRAQATGNPVRRAITRLPGPGSRVDPDPGPVRMLVLGGSQGAKVLNEQVPRALALLDPAQRPQVLHQCGSDKREATREQYKSLGLDAEVLPFIEDMAKAYAWADLAICRAGALTIAELACAGLPAILVPYPHAVDDHQTRNARYLADAGAALLLPQSECQPRGLAQMLTPLLIDAQKRTAMAQAVFKLGQPEATRTVADICQEVLG